jgi:hypothetical protein
MQISEHVYCHKTKSSLFQSLCRFISTASTDITYNSLDLPLYLRIVVSEHFKKNIDHLVWKKASFTTYYNGIQDIHMICMSDVRVTLNFVDKSVTVEMYLGDVLSVYRNAGVQFSSVDQYEDPESSVSVLYLCT